jgi:hypothetical protein
MRPRWQLFANTEQWSGWYNMNGTLSGPPTVFRYPDGHLELFGVNEFNGALIA